MNQPPIDDLLNALLGAMVASIFWAWAVVADLPYQMLSATALMLHKLTM